MQVKLYNVFIISILCLLGVLFGQCTEDDVFIDNIEIASIGNDTIFSSKEYQLEVLLSPESIDAPRLSWSVSDANIASVEYGGILKPIKSGVVTVYVNSLQSGGKKVRGSRKFIVLSSGVFLKDKAVTVDPSKPLKMEYSYMPEDFTPEEKLSWISDNEEIATVDENGLVRGLQLGQTTIKVRLGNPLSGFYSEDSCMVTVKSFAEPKYTYKDGVLEFEQEVPGLLPRTARNFPSLDKIILKGPINGTDLLFFIENNGRINTLDLGETFVVKGGRSLEAVPYGKYKKETLVVEKNIVPYQFFERLKVKNIVVPQYIVSPFSFCKSNSPLGPFEKKKDFLIESLSFPDTYTSIEIMNCNVETINLSKNLETFICNTAFIGWKIGSGLPKALFHKKVVLPHNLKTFHAVVTCAEELVIPSNVKDMSIAGDFKDIIFKPNETLSIEEDFVPKRRIVSSVLLLSSEKFVLPEGLLEVGNKAFADYLPGDFRDNKSKEYANAFKSIIFPKSLKRIGYMAFIHTKIEEAVVTNEGLEEIGHSAFRASSLSEIYISSTVKKIADQAFSECKNLEKVHIKSVSPPQTTPSTFQRTVTMGKIAELYVPFGSKKSYQEAGFSNYFFKIIEE